MLSDIAGLAGEMARLAEVVSEIAARGAMVEVVGLRDDVHLGDGRVIGVGDVVRVNRFVADLLIERSMAALPYPACLLPAPCGPAEAPSRSG